MRPDTDNLVLLLVNPALHSRLLMFFPKQLILVLSLFYGVLCPDALVEFNLKDIKRHEEIFKDTVKEDLKTIGEEIDKFVEDLNTEMEAVREYVKETVKEIQEHAKTNMESSDAVLEKNIADLEVAINGTFSAMNMTMMENLEILSNKTGDERKMLIDWVHQRSHLQEDILKTDVALCAYTSTHHSGSGEPDVWPVTYYNHPEDPMDLDSARPPYDPEGDNGGYVDDKFDWRVYNETCPNDCCSKAHVEACAMEVLNRETGVFKVPVNASGLYMFSFGVTMDARDFDWLPSEKNEYQFRKNRTNIGGVSIFADAAPNAKNDRVPGSMTVLLQLEQYDEVDVVQTRKRKSNDIPDYNPTFCGTLIHLEKVRFKFEFLILLQQRYCRLQSLPEGF